MKEEWFAGSFKRWADVIARYPALIVLFFLAAAYGAFNYTKENLGVNSSTADMFSPELPFRKNAAAFNEAFPILDDNIILVLEGEDDEKVKAALDALLPELRSKPEVFEHVFHAGDGDYFEENQMLYLDMEGLEKLSLELTEAQVFIGALSQDPTIKGLFTIFSGMVLQKEARDALDWNLLADELSNSLNAAALGKKMPMQWESISNAETVRASDFRKLVWIRPNLDYSKLMPAKPAIKAINELKDKYLKEYDTTIRLTGEKALAFDEMKSVTDGAIQAGIFAFILVTITLSIGLRSFRLIVATLITLIVGLLITAAFAAFAIKQLNMISVAFAVLYIGLGVDYAIHLGLRYREIVQKGEPRRQALERTLSDIGPSLILCTVSTAIGFYAFAPTNFSGVSQLGIIAGTGMIVSFIVSLNLFPALVWLLPVRRTFSDAHTSLDSPFTHTLLELPIKHQGFVRGSAYAFAILSAFLLPKMFFDHDPMNLRDSDTESVSTLQHLANEGDLKRWSISVIEADIDKARETARALEKVDGVSKVIMIDDIIPTDQDEKLEILDELSLTLGNPFSAENIEFSSADENRTALNGFGYTWQLSKISVEDGMRSKMAAAIDNFLNAVENDPEKWSQLRDNVITPLNELMEVLHEAMRADYVSIDDLPEDMRSRWVSEDGQYRVLAVPDSSLTDKDSLNAFAQRVLDLRPNATGELIITLESARTVVDAFNRAFIYALLAATILIFAFLRNVRDTVLIILPLLLCGAMTGAATVLLNTPFNFANIIALPLLLGLGVDNGIHIVHRARLKSSTEEVLLNTSTARAVFFSALTTTFSFGNLAFSPHPGTASMGIILTVGVIIMLYSTLGVLPAFIAKGNKK